MKTHFNDPEYAKRMAHKVSSLAIFPPAIPFEKPKSKKSDKDKEEKDKIKTFNVKIDSGNKDSDTVDYHIKVFENGTAEEYVQWLEAYKDVEKALPLEAAKDKVKVIRSVLKETFLETFNTNIPEKLAEDLMDKEVTDALNKVTLKAFNNDRHAYRRQVFYMRHQLYFTTNNFKAFEHRLKQLNKYLKYFPIPPGKTKANKCLAPSELVEIIDVAKPIEYQKQMLLNNYDSHDKSLEDYIQQIERLEAGAKVDAKIEEMAKDAKESSSKSAKKPAKKRKKEEESVKLHKCKYCKKMVTHESKDCWKNPGNKGKRPEWFEDKPPQKKRTNSSPKFTSEQVNFLIKNAHLAAESKKKTDKKAKRKVKFTSESDSEQEDGNAFFPVDITSDNSNNSELEDYFNSTIVNHRTKKKQKKGHATTEVVGEILSQNKTKIPIRILLDTGTSSTIILKPFATNISRYKHSRTRWKTMGGVFNTRRKAKISFRLPEFSHNKTITWTAHVDETNSPSESQYNMIVGTDLLEELKMTLCYKSGTITWDDVIVSMKERGTISDVEMTQDIYELTKESSVLKMSEDRHNEIIKAMYGKIDIEEHVKTLQYLSVEQQKQLADVLKAYPDMYEGAIGTLKIDPVHFELKPNVTPYHARPFPIPKAYERLTKEECR